MERIENLFDNSINEYLISLTVSRPRRKDNPVKKLNARPVLIRDELVFQLTAYKGNQVIHENLPNGELKDRLLKYLGMEYAQLDLETEKFTATALINRKGGVSLKKRPKPGAAMNHYDNSDTGKDINKTDKNNTQGCAELPHMRSRAELSHNRSRNYIIKEGEPVGYLIDLNVMTPDGMVVKRRYDKFRQINRFLEYIEDVVENLPSDREIRIIDFGCGKSYLTFAIYHYLHIIRDLNVRITGLDLKDDVINKCNVLSREYGYDKLEFICGDISDYEIQGSGNYVDMVVTLHACDTATDYALYNAIRWGAGVILSVPCCQHEVSGQISSQLLKPLMKYGIIKERMSALITDGVRAELIDACGYDVQLLEFIDMEHTPKNLMIRAVKKSDGIKSRLSADDLPASLREMMDEMSIRPALYRMLRN